MYEMQEEPLAQSKALGVSATSLLGSGFLRVGDVGLSLFLTPEARPVRGSLWSSESAAE